MKEEGIQDAFIHIISTQGDIGHIALLIVLLAALYMIKLLRDDLKECAMNYINDSKLATAAYTELMTIIREFKNTYETPS